MATLTELLSGLNDINFSGLKNNINGIIEDALKKKNSLEKELLLISNKYDAELKKKKDDLAAELAIISGDSERKVINDKLNNEISKIAAQAGLSIEDFMAALERAKKTGLI